MLDETLAGVFMGVGARSERRLFCGISVDIADVDGPLTMDADHCSGAT